MVLCRSMSPLSSGDVFTERSIKALNLKLEAKWDITLSTTQQFCLEFYNTEQQIYKNITKCYKVKFNNNLNLNKIIAQ